MGNYAEWLSQCRCNLFATDPNKATHNSHHDEIVKPSITTFLKDRVFLALPFKKI